MVKRGVEWCEVVQEERASRRNATFQGLLQLSKFYFLPVEASTLSHSPIRTLNRVLKRIHDETLNVVIRSELYAYHPS